MRQRLQSMLDAVVGQHRAVVRVQAELSLDTEQVQSEEMCIRDRYRVLSRLMSKRLKMLGRAINGGSRE